MNKKKQIRLFKPSFNNDEIKSIKEVFKSPWLGYGEKVKTFENKFSKFIGSNYTIGLNSCTAALHLSIAVNNFKRKKKVLVPVMTFSATAASVLYEDLEPIFVDINENNLNINFEDLKKTQAIFNNSSSFNLSEKEKNILNAEKLEEGEDFEVEIQKIRNIIQ